MALLIDCLLDIKAEVNGKWVVARPLKGPFWWRVKDAWRVLTGKCDAVRFYGQ